MWNARPPVAASRSNSAASPVRRISRSVTRIAAAMSAGNSSSSVRPITSTPTWPIACAPLLVDQQVAAVAVLDRDRRRRVVEDALQAVGLHAQVLVARGERLGHRVERRAELADLAEAGGRHAGVEVAVREPLGGAGDAADGHEHEAVQAEREQRRAARPRARRRRRPSDDHARAQRLRASARRSGVICLLGAAERGELGAHDRRCAAGPRARAACSASASTRPCTSGELLIGRASREALLDRRRGSRS